MRRPSTSGRLSFVVLLFSQLAATTGFMFVIPFMPLYVEQLGVENPGHAAAWAGLLDAAPAVTMALAAPLWGRLGDRVGQKKMLLRATLAGSVMLGLMGLVTAPWQLLLLRLLQGSVTGTVAAATVLTSATAPPEKAPFRLGVLQMFIFVASATGPFAGGAFADLAGIRASFGITSALLATSGFMVLLGVGEARPARSETPEGETSGKEPLPYRLLLPGVLALFAVHLSMTSVLPVMPGFLETLMEEPVRVATLAGQVIGACALAAALGSFAGGRLANRFGTQRVILCALLFAGVSSLPQAWVETVAELWALRLATTFFLGAVIPVANLAVRSSVPRERQGAAFGVAASATSAAFGIGPLAGGLLAATFGFGVPFSIAGVLLICVSIAFLATPRKRTRARLVRAWRTALAHLVR
jgi:DHA1 family multidrug resistance protein-like MFS transporter